jgi:hypothetical protein
VRIDPAPAASAEGRPAPREGHDGVGTPRDLVVLPGRVVPDC